MLQLFTTNVKIIIDTRVAKCENGLRGGGYSPESRTSDIPIWSHIMFCFAQNK